MTEARGHAEAAANSAQQAATSASAAQTSERNAANSATQASQSATAAKQSEDNAAESARNAAASERNAASSADSATQSASAAAQSAESASDDATAAKASAGEAASSAGAAKASETAAASSATAAAESKDAAKASETAAARSAQTATEQVSSIGDSVEQAAASATAAQQSASQAQSNATAANSSAQAAAASAESAQTATESAASSKDAAAQSASEASASAQAAEASKTSAAASASAAEASKTNAAASASAAKASETNAAASATAAQQAVDGFGLEVGTTTTGEPGSDAAVEIQKNGTKYTANFTIPRGDKGEQGVGGSDNVLIGNASGVIAVADDAYSNVPRQIRVHGETIENFWKYEDGKNADVNISIDDSGLIAFYSDTTAQRRYAVFFDFPDEYLEPGKYTIYNWSSDPNIRVGISTGFAESDAQIDGTSQCNANSSSTFEVISGRGYRFSVNLESRTVGKAFTSYVRAMIVKGENVLDEFTPSGTTTANPEKLCVRTNNFFPNISGVAQNGITLTQDANGVYHMDGVAITTGRALWSVVANVPSGDYVFKHSASRSGIDGCINAVKPSKTTFQTSSAAGTKGSITSSANSFVFYIRDDGLQQGVEYHDTVQIVLSSGTDIPSDFPKNESSEVALPSDLNLVDGDTLVIDRDGSARITHSSGEPTPSTPVTLPEIPAPTFAIYTEGGLSRPTVDVDYERDVNLVIRDLEAKIAALEVVNKTNQ